MNTTLELLNKKLKDAPESVLERVLGYVDAIIENSNKKPYELTREQQSILDSQVNDDKVEYQKVEDLEKNLKRKYDL